MASKIRPERSFEIYSRGLQLVRQIQSMWDNHKARRLQISNQEINANIMAIVNEHGLTVHEWHYWCRIAEAK